MWILAQVSGFSLSWIPSACTGREWRGRSFLFRWLITWGQQHPLIWQGALFVHKEVRWQQDDHPQTSKRAPTTRRQCWHPVLDLQPPGLWEDECLLFKSPRLWHFVMAAWARWDGVHPHYQVMSSLKVETLPCSPLLPQLQVPSTSLIPKPFVVRNPPIRAGDVRDVGWEDSAGEGTGNPLQDSRLENSMDRGVWRATVHGVAKNQTGLKRLSMHPCKAGILIRHRAQT